MRIHQTIPASSGGVPPCRLRRFLGRLSATGMRPSSGALRTASFWPSRNGSKERGLQAAAASKTKPVLKETLWRGGVFLLAVVMSLVPAPREYGQSAAPARPTPANSGALPSPTAATKPTPAVRQLDIGYAPTPREAVAKLLELADLRPGDVVYDLGCGDGRIVVAAAKQYGVQAVGIDLDPLRVKESRENIRTNQVGQLATIVEGDFFKVDLSSATVVTLYVGTELNQRLMPRLSRLKPGTRILSFDHPMPGAKPVETVCGTRIEDGHEYTIYKWVVPWASE